MSEKPDQGRAERLRQAREAAGFESAAEAATKFKWNENTYRANENGNATFSFKKAKEYARAFGVRPEWLYEDSGPASPTGAAEPQAVTAGEIGEPIDLAALREFIKARNGDGAPPVVGRLKVIERRIPVVGLVEAGIWREAVARLLEDVDEFLPIEIPGYERAQLKAYKVAGPSMNLVYPDGRYVVVAHPSEAGVRMGDYVIVERHKLDVVEITLKEIDIDAQGRIVLWPRSTHPDHQAPIYLRNDDMDQTAPQIIGVVIADFNRRTRPPASLRG